MDINFDKISELADLVIEKQLAEITVQDGEQSVTIKLPLGPTTGLGNQSVYYAPASGAAPTPATTTATATVTSATPSAPADEDAGYLKVTSPMVGTYYAAPSPDSPPFVKVGDAISKGQAVCIIEAMKMMNELESEIGGKVVKILVSDAQPVEFGQPIMLVDPNG